MISISHENKTYVNADYILVNAPIYSKGVRSTRSLIKKKNIENVNYIFAREKNNEWILTDGKSAKLDMIFINETIIDTIPELNNNNDKITDDKGIEKAPKLIRLNDNEKFQDDQGNFIEIETRGSRNVDSIYFKVKDVMTGFKIDNLQTTIIDKRSTGYKENEHYKYFIIKKKGETQNKTSKIKTELYLTYEGMLRVLFASHSPNVKPFIKWATEKLFTLQMGTVEQKENLVGSVLGVNAKVIKEVFNTDRNSLPCVYLFTLNTVKELRTSMNISSEYADDSIVAKFGFTRDLSRRTGEHITKYNKIQNVDLKLKHYAYVDPQYMSNAETDIKDIMMAFKINLNFDNEDELVIIPKELIKIVERHYELIGKNYMGHISELITRIKELEDKYEKELLKHELELEKVNHNLELQKEKYENQLLKKDLENIKLQIQLNKY